MPVEPAQFRSALAQFGSGVTVVTTRDARDRPLGITVSAFCSVSLQPPLVLVSVSDRSEINAAFRESGVFGVSVLAEHQESVSRQFALGGSEKFAGLDLLSGEHGVMLIPGALAHIECRVAAAHPAGDHIIYIGEVLALKSHPGRPLLYQRGDYRRLEAE